MRSINSAHLGTLSAVARERDVAVSQISRVMTQLETRHGVQLLHRTTHGLSLTAEGDVFLGYCRNITQTLDELDGEFTSRARNVRGVVRIAMSANMAQHVIIPSLGELTSKHPGLIVDLAVSDALVTNIDRLRKSRSPQVTASVPILPTPVVEIGKVKTGPCCTEPFHESLSSRSTWAPG